MKTTTSQNGFTLIELIIVMVILGIMAAVAVPRYLDSIENAEESAENAVISSIRSVFMLNYLKVLSKEAHNKCPNKICNSCLE